MKYIKLGGLAVVLLVLALIVIARNPSTVTVEASTKCGYNPVCTEPSISEHQFTAFLAARNSPATREGPAMYKKLTDKWIDPAIALGFFGMESSWGKQGVARKNLGIGNIRCTIGYTCIGDFRAYPDWTTGAADWADLMVFYSTEWKLNTLEEIIPRYAPGADNNDEARYIKTVKQIANEVRNS